MTSGAPVSSTPPATVTATVTSDPRDDRPPHPDPGLVDALSLAAAYADDLIVATARDTHRAVADRFFGAATRSGVLGPTPQRVHDGISALVYGAISRALRGAGAGLGALGARDVGPRLDASPGGRVLQSAVNGLIGDRLRDEHPHLALAMAIRADGRVVLPEPKALVEAFPHATDRVVVFLHGLGEHEQHWELRRDELGGTYGSRLEAAAGWTPVYLRINTGLPVAENGVALTSLLQEMVDAWPTEVRRIALVGHSMGGLIIRAGCAVATSHPRPWVELLSDVVTLGTPHHGADLALGVSHGARLLGLTPEVAGFGRILDHRSPGIRDLEHGLPELPPLPQVRYRLVSASLGSSETTRGRVVGWLLGDMLVRRPSATASSRRRRALRLFPDADLLHVPQTGHFSLLNHPEVYEAMKRWFA